MAKFCHNCGAQLADDSEFCMSCGARQVAVQQVSQQPQPAAAPGSAGQPQTPPAAPQPPKKKKKTGLIAGIAAAVVVLALAAVAVLWVWPSFLSAEARYDKYMERGDTALEAEQYADACEAYSKAISLKLEKADPYLGRGDAYLALESFDEAIADYESALELEPARGEIYLKLADAYVADGDTERAQEILRDGIDAADDTKKLESRLDELSPPLSELPSLSGAAALIQESLSGSELVQSVQEQTGISLAEALVNTSQAVEDAMAGSPYAALGTFFSALVEGQISVSAEMHDEQHSASLQADLCTDLEALEASLTASITADGETAAGEVYLGSQFAAFHSDLVDREWYGITWETLLDDLEASIFVENGVIAAGDIAAIRQELDTAFAMTEQYGALDLSGIDVSRYLALLLSIEPSIETGTDAAGRGYLTVSVPFSAVAGALADVLDELTNDASVMELVAQIVEMQGEDASGLRAQWQSELALAATEIRDTDVSGSVDVTFYTANGYLDTIVITGDPVIDGEAVNVNLTMSFEYENSQLGRFDFLLDVDNGSYGYSINFNYETASETSGAYADRCSFQYNEGYDTISFMIENDWDCTSGAITTTVSISDGYSTESGSLSYNLQSASSGAELRFDLYELTGLDGEAVLAAYPGNAYIDKPSSYVNLDEWDETFLENLENAMNSLKRS